MDPSGYCHRKSWALPHPQNRTGSGGFSLARSARFALDLTMIHRFACRLAYSLTLRNTRKSLWLFFICFALIFLDQALDRLVSSSSIRCRTSTDDLSTLSSSRGLTCICSGNSILQVGFTLRCLQRLSLPHFASQLCHWHDNCCTRGASIPVLSY